MRNTLQYPITTEEMLAALEDAIGFMQPRGIGDIRPVALREVHRIIAAQGIAARSDETAQQAQPEGQEPGSQSECAQTPESKS